MSLKPGWKTSEGQIAFGIVAAGVGAMWYLVTKEAPPMLSAESLMQYAENADHISILLEMAAEEAKGNSPNWDSLAVPGGIMGVVTYIVQMYAKTRTKLKAADMVTSAGQVDKIQFS